jgi:hypothetical protein
MTIQATCEGLVSIGYAILPAGGEMMRRFGRNGNGSRPGDGSRARHDGKIKGPVAIQARFRYFRCRKSKAGYRDLFLEIWKDAGRRLVGKTPRREGDVMANAPSGRMDGPAGYRNRIHCARDSSRCRVAPPTCQIPET